MKKVLLYFVLCLLLSGCSKNDNYKGSSDAAFKLSDNVTDDWSDIDDIKEESEGEWRQLDEIEGFNYRWYEYKFYRGVGTDNILWIDTRFENSRGETYISGTTSMIDILEDYELSFYEKPSGEVAVYENTWTNKQGEEESIILSYYPKDDIVMLNMTASPYTGKRHDYSDIYVYDEERTNKMAPRLKSQKEDFELEQNVQSSGDIIIGQSYINSENGAILSVLKKNDDDTYACIIDDVSVNLKQRDVAGTETLEYAFFYEEICVGTIYYTINENTMYIDINGEMVRYEGTYYPLVENPSNLDSNEDGTEIETHYETMIYGSEYECFETESGDDVIMYLWPEESYGELGISFGDSDDGLWLSMTEETDEYIVFEANTGEAEYSLKWYRLLCEIEFVASNGDLKNMNGKYIGLPD